MSACVIGHITVRDPDKWSEYRSKVPPTLAHGRRVIFRGKVFCGELPYVDTVVIRFPDASASDDDSIYRALIPLRHIIL